MKTDLTNLDLEAQIGAVADRLRDLTRCSITDVPDLQRYFKHRAFRENRQRAWHFHQLLAAALLLLNGRKAEFDNMLAAMKANGVIYEAGDQVRYDGEQCRVIEVQPEGKLFVETSSGCRRTISARAVQPILPTDTKPWPIACDSTR